MEYVQTKIDNQISKMKAKFMFLKLIQKYVSLMNKDLAVVRNYSFIKMIKFLAGNKVGARSHSPYLGKLTKNLNCELHCLCWICKHLISFLNAMSFNYFIS